MATLNASTLNDTQYSGDCPLANAHGVYTFAATPAADVVRLVKLYAGTKIHDIKLVNAALGASTTISLGFSYVNGEAGGGATALLAATSTVSAAATRMGAISPVTLEYDAFITATVGGGAATGKIDVIVTFEFKGE